MRLLDASSVIDLWENYPLGQFPTVWQWFESEVVTGALAVSTVALTEVGHRDPRCRTLLKGFGISELAVGNDEAIIAARIKVALGIVGENYGSGVDENDILIISIAKVGGCELITNERRQPNLPATMRNYKIPATCSLATVGVQTVSMLEYIVLSGRVF